MADRPAPIRSQRTAKEPDDVRAGHEPVAAPAVTGVEVHRTAEAWFRPAKDRLLGEDVAAFDATLRADPGGYRVLRVGPFEYVQEVQPVPRALSLEVGDRLAAAATLPVLVEGSQSPLSVKPPHGGADVDVLVAVGARDDLARAKDVMQELRGLQADIPAPLAVGIVHQGWLRLPGFYSAVRLGTGSPDRRWWHASAEERLAEAARRITQALAFLGDRAAVERLLHESVSWLGGDPAAIREWRITPRWVGFELLAGLSR